MSGSEHTHQPALEHAASLRQLEENYHSLRLLFQGAILCVLVLSCSLSVFFLREVSASRKQARELSRFVSDYQRNSLPLIMDLRARLQAFGQEHPDFSPILQKYFGDSGLGSSPMPEGRPSTPFVPGEP
jgi:hypothetical protein